MSLELHESDWIVQVNESLNPSSSLEQQQWEKHSIYRVPTHVANLNPEAYRPQVVSFGPYHHGEDHLLPMEEHKRRALTCFLKRSKKSCEPFLESLSGVAQKLEESYDALDPKWKESREFLELMITDGCFMLEIMRMVAREVKNDYAANDPIFSLHGLAYITPYIGRDMLMLENQLPMLVLECLVEVERDGRERGLDDKPETPQKTVHDLILKFYSRDTRAGETHPFLHVMDGFRNGLLYLPTAKPNDAGILCSTRVRVMDSFQPVMNAFRMMLENMVQCGTEADGDEIIRSATELHEAGIQFKKSKSKTDSLKDISFDKGVLWLSLIKVDDATETIFLNIMTFERLHIEATTEVTSYVTFLDSIINNERDVALLHEQGIIQNAYGSDKEVAELINSLCTEVSIASNSSLDAVQKEISAHCKKPCNMWRAYFNRTYFRNPWTILSLIAAIFLFALTTIQTVYTAVGYY